MIVELTPENYFEYVKQEGPLHVVMHYGVNCGPCKNTMPHYEHVEAHFVDFKVTNVRFYKFHHWEKSYKDFIQDHNLQTKGVPTLKYFYFGDVINETAGGYSDSDVLKRAITDTIKGIETTTKMEFDLYAS